LLFVPKVIPITGARLEPWYNVVQGGSFISTIATAIIPGFVDRLTEAPFLLTSELTQ